jgi:hypothetical protein
MILYILFENFHRITRFEGYLKVERVKQTGWSILTETPQDFYENYI